PNPAILIADEPTGNLDETTGAEIIDLLFAGHAQRASTLVLVTHDAALAARCDRVVRLRSGRIETAAQHEPAKMRAWGARCLLRFPSGTAISDLRCALPRASCAAACAVSTYSWPASRSGSRRSPASARWPRPWPRASRAKDASSWAATSRSR